MGRHTVTEDYSSYESVDEEETPPPAKPVTKGKGKKVSAPAAVKDECEADKKSLKAPVKSASAPSLKRKPSKPSVQKGGITSYFTKK